MLHAPHHGFSYLHVPKCAGVTITETLEGIADVPRASFDADCPGMRPDRGAWSEHIVTHPELGRIHLAHVPLPVLRSHFPKTFELVLASESFSVVRAPRARFFSALMQRLREFKGYGASMIDDGDLKREAREVMSFLMQHEAYRNLTFIHFARQTDYLDLDGQRVVQQVFPIGELDALWSWMRQRFGIDAQIRQSNASVQPKPALKALLRRVGPAYRSAVPQSLRQQVFNLSRRAGLLEKASSNYDRVDLGPEVERFITDYYAADAEAYTAARARRTQALAI